MTEIAFDEFIRSVAEAAGVHPAEVDPRALVVDGLGLDELSWASVVLAITELNPYFEIPEQLDISEATVADIYHFCQVMTADHRAAG